MPCMVRDARPDDLLQINDIYNHYVLHSTCTYQEVPDSMDARRAWFAAHGPQHPVTVALVDGGIVGWGALSPFRPRSGYRFTVENSVYVHHERHRQGIGDALLADLIDRAYHLGHRTIVAGIDAGQPASIAIHEKHGFTTAGHLREVALKFGRWLDVIFMQRLLSPPSREA